MFQWRGWSACVGSTESASRDGLRRTQAGAPSINTIAMDSERARRKSGEGLMISMEENLEDFPLRGIILPLAGFL